MFHRSKATGSGRRSVRGAAIFATLALGLSVSSFAFIGSASAGQWDGHNKTCNQIEGVSAQQRGWSCYTVDTWVQPSDVVPLGTAVHDYALVEKHWDNPCDLSLQACQSDVSAEQQGDWNSYKYVTFELFEGGYCDGDYAAEPEDVAVNWDGGDWNGDANSADWNWHNWDLNASSSDIVLPAGEYSYFATFYTGHHNGYANGYCEPFTVEKADPTVATTIVPSDFVETSDTVHDTATIEDQVDGFEATGTVNFTFFKNGHCDGSGQVAGAAEVDPDTGIADGSDETLPLADGEYSYMAHYEGDSNYNSAFGVCEALNVRGGTVTPVEPVNPPPAVAPAAAAVVAAARFTG